MKTISVKDLKELEAMKETAAKALEALKEKLEELANSAEEYYDDRSETWQESENGTFYREWVDTLEDRANDVDSLLDEVNNIDFEDIQSPPKA